MGAIAVTDLIKGLDRDDVLADMVTVAGAVGLTTNDWETGEPVYDVLTIFADQITTKWNTYVVPWLQSKFLDYAAGDWLTLRAWTDYYRYRSLATFAGGDVPVENRGGGFYTFAAGDVRIKNTNGLTFTNTDGGTLPPWSGSGAFPTVTLSFSADAAGTASNTAIGAIQTYPIPPVKAPANVYAQANASALLGSDEEADPNLKTRCQIAKAQLSSMGPRNIYASVALDVRRDANGNPVMPNQPGYQDATPLNISRVRIVEPGNSTVLVYLASPSGPASGDTSTPGSDVYIANAAIQMFAVPAGIVATVAAATALPISLGLITVYVDRGALVQQQDAINASTAALTQWFSQLPVGGMKKTGGGQGYVFANEVSAVAKSRISVISGAQPYEAAPGVFDCDLTLSDTAVAPGQVAVPAFSVQAVLVDQR